MEGGVPRCASERIALRTVRDCAWDGVRLLHLQAEPAEVPEGALVNHVVFMNLGADATCEARVGGAWHEYRFPRHAVTVFPAGMTHGVRCRTALETLAVEIGPGFAEAVLREPGPASGIRPVLGAQDAFTTHVLLALAEEARVGGAMSALRAEALAAALVASLASREIGPPPPVPQQPDLPSPKLRRVLDHVANRLDTPLTLQRLADLAEMDLFRFVRAFKQTTGLSPHRYIVEARIARAKDLLRDGRISITEIALRTGFATPSHFSVTFRRITGTTPRAFRDRPNR
jgi:AraC family transcriptional regulator